MNAEQIKSYRKEKGMSQKKLAETVGISSASIALMESGKRPVNEKVASFFEKPRARRKTAATKAVTANNTMKAKSVGTKPARAAKGTKALDDKFVNEIENSDLSKRTKSKILKQLVH